MSWWKNKESTEPERHAPVETKSSPLGGASSSASKISPGADSSDVSDIEKKYGTVRSALSSGTVIQGKLSFDTPVRIDGSLMGEVFSSSVLIVGRTGNVSADINVETLIVLGSVSGDIKARKRLELHSTGELVGNIDTPSLSIEQGAYFDGVCKMSSEERVKEDTRESTTTLHTKDIKSNTSSKVVSDTKVVASDVRPTALSGAKSEKSNIDLKAGEAKSSGILM